MNEKLNIQYLVDCLVEKHDMNKRDAETFVKDFFLLIEEALKKDKYVKVKGLGTFKLINIDSRESVNINTGERFEIQQHTKISFTPEPSVREAVNKPFSCFEAVLLNGDALLKEMKQAEEDDLDLPIAILESSIVAPESSITNKVMEDDGEMSVTETSNGEAEETESKVKETAGEEKDLEMSGLSPADNFIDDSDVCKETPATKEKDESDEKKTWGIKLFIGILGAVVIACLSVLLYLYFPDIKDITGSHSQLQTMEETVPTESLPEAEQTLPLVDTLIAERQVPVVVEEKQIENKAKISKPENKPVPFTPDSVNYMITGTQETYVIGEGETLTRVALRFYGTKTLWPYLVMHNRDIIKNPDNVPVGVAIKIPKLVKKE